MTTATNVLLRSVLPGIPLVSHGKVRDVYAVDDQRLLLIATDRISAFDVVMPNGIPDKGRVLTQLSLFWFQRLRDMVRTQIMRNHLHQRQCERVSHATAPVPRAVGRAQHAGAQTEDRAHRMHRARLPRRLRMEGISEAAARCAASRCPRGCANRSSCRSRSSPRPPKRKAGTT